MKKLLIIDPGSNTFRSYIIRTFKQNGFLLFIAAPKNSDWAKEYAKEFLEFGEDHDFISDIISFGKGNNVDGVLTYSEEHVSTAAKVGKALNLPHLNPEIATIIRNKYLLRKKLEEVGIQTVKAFKVSSAEEAVKCAQKIGFPVVVKPINGHSSIGVVKAESKDDIYIAAKQIQRFKFESLKSDFIVEEYIEGPEVSIECFVKDSKPYVIGITDKRLSKEPFFEEIGHTVPSSLPPSIQYLFVSYAVQILTALDFNLGIAHIEARLTKDGPKLIEIGARLGGDFIPKLVKLASNIDLPLISALLACGESVQLEEFRTEAASIEFIVPSKSGIIKDIFIPDTMHSKILEFEIWGQVGQHVVLPPERYLTRLGYTISKGSTSKESLNLVQSIVKSINIEIAK